MEIEKICNKFTCNLTKCAECKIVVKSYYQNENANDSFENSNDFLEIPSQSTYFHLNDELLTNKNSDKSFYRDKNILLIGCGSIKRMSVLRSIRELGLNKLVCLCRNKEWAFNYVDEWIYAEHEDLSKIDQTLEAVESYILKEKIKFDAIITYDDYCTLVTFYIANKFNLPSIPIELAKKIKNKFKFRQLCDQLGIFCPGYFLIESSLRQNYINRLRFTEFNWLNSLDNQNKLNYPVIVKNPIGAGKDFIKKCKSSKELIECLENSLIICSSMDLLVEEFYEGHEIDIDILIQNNQIKFMAISDNFPALEPNFYEQGGVCPSIQLSDKDKKRIEIIVTKWLDKINFQDACLHFEAKCNSQEENCFLMPIEINMRLGGAETWSMIKASYDVNLIQEYINLCLGININLEDKAKNPRFRCISKDFHPFKYVIIDSLRLNFKKLNNSKNIVEISIFKTKGDRISPKDNIGWTTVKCDFKSSYEKIDFNLNEVLNWMYFSYKDI